MHRSFHIGRHEIGSGRTFIVAELSANHQGSLKRAARIVNAAAEAGADAVKVQTYTPDTMTLNCGLDQFQIRGESPWAGRTLYELYKEAHMPWDWHAELKTLANNLGLEFFSSPFDDTAVDFLEELGVPAYKIASFEIVHLPLLRKAASTGKPVILSTGMATPEEIDEALQAIRAEGNKRVALLKCTSAYPAPLEEMNLASLPHMAQRFETPVGLSDHTLSDVVPVVAVSLGACIVEKHLTLKRGEGGPDAGFSLETDEFARMVKAIRDAEKTIGTTGLHPSSSEQGNLQFRRSIFVTSAIAKGEAFSPDNLRVIRPGHGMHPRRYEELLGRRAARDLPLGTALQSEDVED